MQKNYGADSIQVLEGLEAVRKRPAMYIGDVSFKGLHHLVYEVVDNSIDEALAGYATRIDVTINEDNSITVKDDGRGIPVEIHKKEGRSALEVVMTVLHAGGKFDKDSYKVSGGLHGVGVSCVNALSTHMKVEVHRNDKIYRQEYKCGIPQYPVKEVGKSDTTGTIATFKPDGDIFTVLKYNYDTLAARLRELSFLNKGITLTLTDLREKDDDGNLITDTFHSEGGLSEFVRYLDASREALTTQPVHLGVMALQLAAAFGANVYVTGGSEEGCAKCEELGEKLSGSVTALDYNTQRFEDVGPFDGIMDILGGGGYFERHVETLKSGGVLRIISYLKGNKTESGYFLGNLLKENASFSMGKQVLFDTIRDTVTYDPDHPNKTDMVHVLGGMENGGNAKDSITVGADRLRGLGNEGNQAIMDMLREHVVPLIARGAIEPVVAEMFAFKEIDDALHAMRNGGNPDKKSYGKIVVEAPTETDIQKLVTDERPCVTL